jgi:DNA-directed RNA polymerase specialized sigma subunit
MQLLAPQKILANNELAQLWLLYKNDRDLEAKDRLLLHYVYLVKQIVRRMMPRYNNYNE